MSGYYGNKHYDPSPSDPDFDLMVREEMERLEKQVREKVKDNYRDDDDNYDMDENYDQGYENFSPPPMAQASRHKVIDESVENRSVASKKQVLPMQRGIATLGDNEISKADKKAKQVEYFKQLENGKHMASPKPRYESHEDSPVLSGQDIFSNMGKGDSRSKSRTNYAGRNSDLDCGGDSKSVDIFSNLGKGDPRSKSRTNSGGRQFEQNSDRYSAMSPLSDAEARRGKSSAAFESGPSILTSIGAKEAEISSNKKAKQQEYSRQLAAQKEQDELKRQQRLEEDRGVPYGRSRSANRATPAYRDDTDSPLSGKPSTGDSSRVKLARQQEYFKQLKDQQELDYNAKEAKGLGGRRSSGADGSGHGQDEYDGGGIMRGIGARERPKSAGRRRLNAGAATSNIFSSAAAVSTDQSKREMQDQYRRQLLADASKQAQYPPTVSSGRSQGIPRSQYADEEENYEDEELQEAAPYGNVGRRDVDDYALDDLVRRQGRQGQGQGQGQGQARGGGYPRMQEEPSRQQPARRAAPPPVQGDYGRGGGGGGGGMAERRASDRQSEGTGTGLIIGGMQQQQVERGGRRGQPAPVPVGGAGERNYRGRGNSSGGGGNSFRIG